MPCSVLWGSSRGPVGVWGSPSPRYTLFVSHILVLDDHIFDALTARTCNGHPLLCSSTKASVCVSDADAASVFAIGDFEYELHVPVLFFSIN